MAYTTTQGTVTPQGTVNYDPNTGAKLSAGQTVNVNQGNSTVGAIPTTALSTPQTPIIPVTSKVPDLSAMGANANAYIGNSTNEATLQADAQAKQAEKDAQVSSLANLQSSIGNRGADQLAANNQVDANGNSVNSLAGKLRSINAQSQALSLDTLAKQQAEINKATGQNITSTAVQRNTSDATRDNLINTAKLAMESAIVKADYDTAKSYADQIVEAKYAQKLADIEAAKTNIDNIKENLTEAQKKVAEATKLRLEKEKQNELDKKAEAKELQNLSLSIGKNGAPASVVSKIANAKTFNDAVIVAAPYMQSLTDKADLSYKLAQTAKIYNDIRNDNAVSGGNVDPSQSLAYAQQYASTGMIPTGLPKGSFGKIAEYAKELPKPDGTLVDINTGVRPSKLSADEEKGISATYDIVNKKLPLLIEKFNSNYTGVLGGIGGAIYTTQDRQDFETTRGEVLNLLLQARSGATVSPQEYERYSKLIPTSFNQPFFVGSDGAKKLQSLQNSLTDTLNSKLSTSGASIYGYSKVKTSDGVERTVGDIIEVNGVRGRINHDGTVTQVQ